MLSSSSALRVSRRLLSTSSTSAWQPHYGAWIHGKEFLNPSLASYAIEDPARRQTLCTVQDADSATVDLAVASGRAAFKSGVWSRMDVRDRAEILHESARALRLRVPEFAHTESMQTGRAIREMNAQLGRLPEWLEYFAAVIRTHEGTVPPFKGNYVNYVKRVPLGVCAQITPWNHPMLIAIKKIAPALAAGNSIVVKPSEFAPITVLEFAKLMTECGLPDGVFNCVAGQGECGAALAKHSDLDMVDLTGGTPTGKKVHAAAGANLTPVLSELGGKAPMIVFNDADIEQAVNGTVFGSFVATGQTCIAGTRLLVQEDIYEDFVEKYVAKVEKIKIGDPQDPSTQMGPLINAGQMEKVSEFCVVGKAEGGKILCGGKPAEGLPAGVKDGHYWHPTVIGDCQPNMRVVREEVFGPVVVAYPFKDETDAIEKANDSEFGLAASVWTENIKKAHRVADQLDVGIVWLNDHHRNDPSSPWGGMKDSGVGRENGLEALAEYSQTRSVVVGFGDDKFDWFQDETQRVCDDDTAQCLRSPVYLCLHCVACCADFTETMRALGYPRLISVMNFKTPNFELVADVLYWMVRRYDPDITVHDGIESEEDRVSFLTSICAAMLSRASIRLNPKKLYAADGHAVKELLKVAECLYDANRYSSGVDGSGDGGEWKEGEEEGEDVPITSRFGDVKSARNLASEITERGARLHDLLKREMEVREVRGKAIRFLERMEGNLESGEEQQYIEKRLNEIIETTREDVEKMKRQVDDFTADSTQLQEKIVRKTTDLERNKKRLASLQHVRPAFMDEYEKFERELMKQYEVYLERFRNLDYLEHELDNLNESEKEKYQESERAMKKMQQKLREEELKILRGEGDVIDENSGSAGGGKGGIFGQRMGKEGGGGLRDNSNLQGAGGGGRVQGKMGGGDSDFSDEDLTHDSDDVSADGSVSSSGGSSESSNLIENDDGSDSDSSDGDDDEGADGRFDNDDDDDFDDF